MRYKLVRDNPYDGKKITLLGRMKSVISGALICLVVFTVSMRIRYSYLLNQTKETYSKSIVYYEDMIKEIACFFKENGVETPEECFELYVKLLWNGCFSYGGTYHYEENEDSLFGYFGLNVMTGKGDCKNNEDLFCKLMTELGYPSYQVVCTCYSDVSELSLMDGLFGNHVITVVLFHGTAYYFDTTNLCTYEKQSIHSVSSEEKELTSVLKPVISYMYCYQDVKETMKLIYLQSSKNSGKDYLVSDQLEEKDIPKVLVLGNKLKNSVREISNAINGK